MLPIFSYCLVRTNISNMHSKLKFLEDFADEDILRSGLGYAIATLQTVVDSLTKWTFQDYQAPIALNALQPPMNLLSFEPQPQVNQFVPDEYDCELNDNDLGDL